MEIKKNNTRSRLIIRLFKASDDAITDGIKAKRAGLPKKADRFLKESKILFHLAIAELGKNSNERF